MRTFTQVCAEVLESYERLNKSKSDNIFVRSTNARDLLDMAVKVYVSECTSLTQTYTNDDKQLSAEQLWDVYAEAVSGKTFDGKPLPKFSKLGKQQVGWLAIAQAINAKPEPNIKLKGFETAVKAGEVAMQSLAKDDANPELYAHIKFEELYIFGLNAGKEQKNTLKFVDGFVEAKSLNKSSEVLEFSYTSATTGEERFAVFMKSNISGYSYTQADTVSTNNR